MVEPRQLTSILDVLMGEGVQFVLVDALAALTQGAPLTTHDVDIVHTRTPENVDRLMAALGKLNARYRGRSGDSPLPPDRRALATTGHSLLTTDALLPLSIELDMDGRSLRVLGLETIVAIKRMSTHQKDRLALPVLEATLTRRNQGRPTD